MVNNVVGNLRFERGRHLFGEFGHGGEEKLGMAGEECDSYYADLWSPVWSTGYPAGTQRSVTPAHPPNKGKPEEDFQGPLE